MNTKTNNEKVDFNDLKFYVLNEKMVNELNFNCGDNDLNEFIKKDAITNMKFNLSVIYLCKYNTEVVGYLAISNDSIKIRKEDKLKMGKTYKYYPAIKIGRLAIDKKFQKKQIGTLMIKWVGGIGIKLRKEIGIKFISVDAYIKSKEFYEKNSFKVLENNNKNKHNISMYLDLK
ncbi:MAG: GNAT family N-acetyltransferase [Methanobrevibacter sp.]|jgi:GNAT superfamily N-acetyltransferase|nr:GNAT family N-acetyltransferase [Methanobrevibacter sp.]